MNQVIATPPTIRKVYFRHFRVPAYMMLPSKGSTPTTAAVRYFTGLPDKWHERFGRPQIRGGITECILVLTDETLITGTANCSVTDAFVYRIGRSIAFGRAMKAYNERLYKLGRQAGATRALHEPASMPALPAGRSL